MSDFKIDFSLDGKIASNRARLKELYDQYKRIENYYPLFFAYLGFIGVYFFDFILFIFSHDLSWRNGIFAFCCICTSTGVVWSLILMVKIVRLRDWEHDPLPKVIYEDTRTLYMEEYPTDKDEEIIQTGIKESYLTLLEEAVETNNQFCKDKKQNLSDLLEIIVITLILYACNIIHYKFLVP